MVPSSLIFSSVAAIGIGVSMKVIVSESPTRSTSGSGPALLVAARTAAGLETGAVTGTLAGAVLAAKLAVRVDGACADCCLGDCDRQPTRQSPLRTSPQSMALGRNPLPTRLILI